MKEGFRYWRSDKSTTIWQLALQTPARVCLNTQFRTPSLQRIPNLRRTLNSNILNVRQCLGLTAYSVTNGIDYFLQVKSCFCYVVHSVGRVAALCLLFAGIHHESKFQSETTFKLAVLKQSPRSKRHPLTEESDTSPIQLVD